MQTDSKEFVVITTQRSGSAYFERILNSHSDIICEHERFLNTGFDGDWYYYGYWLARIAEDPANLAYPKNNHVLRRYLEKCFSAPNTRAVGFDVKYNQFGPVTGLFAELRARRVKVIHLIRANVLKTYWSSVLNEQQANLNRKSHGTKHVAPVFRDMPIDGLSEKLLARVKDIEWWRNCLNRKFDCLEVGYEDCLRDRDSEGGINPDTLERVYDFLGVEDRSCVVGTDLKKTNPAELQDTVKNFMDVKVALAGTIWEGLLAPNIDRELLMPAPGHQLIELYQSLRAR